MSQRQGQYGRLTIIKEVAPKIYSSGKKLRVLAKCDCGNEKEYFFSNLKKGNTSSCGCYNIERSTTHGYRDHPLYNVWKHIKYRCIDLKNGSYGYYGGRGIKICEEWLDPKIFIDWCLANGWKKGLEIDRINNNGNYEPGNCRFVAGSLQSRNRRGYGTSLYRGVCWHKYKKKWAANAKLRGKTLYLGCFIEELDALAAVNEWHRVNMPNNPELLQRR